MKRGKPMILLLTVLLAAIAVVFGRNEISMRNFPFSVLITSDGVREEIRCMKLSGEYYVFLPAYGTSDNVRICTNPVYEVSIDGQWLEENQSCEAFPINTKLELYFRSAKNEGYETVTFVRSANVPTMYIDVASGHMDYIHEKKGNAEAASVRLYTADGVLDYTGSAETVKGRGNATWEDAEKKSYSLTLLQDADLLELGKASNWILLSNVWDSSGIRNKLAYDTAAVGLEFSPASNWVDLYLNGEYAGLYLLSERNEIHPERVNIPENTSFLVSLEFPYRLVEQGYPHVKTERGLALRIHHSSLAQGELQELWQSVENAILAENGIDPVTGKHWEELIDLDSWAHKYLLEELFGNYDAGSISQYFYCDTSSSTAKIYAGPIWDFDNSMGRGGWVSSNPKSILAARSHFFSNEDAPLFYSLCQKEAFHDRVVELFDTLYEPLLEQLLDDTLQSYEDTISCAKIANHYRWDSVGIQNVEEIRRFLRERLEFFHDLWIDGSEYCAIEITYDYGAWACWMVPRGGYLSELPQEETIQWCNALTGEPFDRSEPVLENMRLIPMKE